VILSLLIKVFSYPLTFLLVLILKVFFFILTLLSLIIIFVFFPPIIVKEFFQVLVIVIVRLLEAINQTFGYFFIR